MRESGLFNLIANRIVGDLVDYTTGVEVGLDSNGRKNRGGKLMESVVEAHIIAAGITGFHKEMTIRGIEDNWGTDLSVISNKGKTVKRFDFVIKTSSCIYAIETNFYTGSGSKLNETARSYKSIAQAAKEIKGFRFIWITDGSAWKTARGNLEETFDILDDIYNLTELEAGILSKVIK
jgi:type II restriction enzyme